jgi:hypothetical protein
VITRVWICCTTHIAEGTLERLQELFETVSRNLKGPFSAQATHAAQTVRCVFDPFYYELTHLCSFFGRKLRRPIALSSTLKPKGGARHVFTCS